MEDVFKFLLVAAVIGIGLIRQFKKEADKNAKNKPVNPIPHTDLNKETCPFPAEEEETYGGYIPKGPKTVISPNSSAHVKSIKKTKKAQTGTILSSQPRSVLSPDTPPSPINNLDSIPEENSEFAIHSPEEARKAIIWSEILQRKY